jgi:predicted O-methyltransferase YrrM
MHNNEYFSEQELASCDLGNNNILRMYNVVEKAGENKKFVDLGVRQGVSSSIFLYNAEEKNNTVYGADLDFNFLNSKLKNSKKYYTLLADTVTLGKRWNEGNIDILFVDTLHIKEQVLCELYYWAEKINENGVIIFHDTAWEEGKKDTIAEREWDRVEDAIHEFFSINTLNYKDEFIESLHFTESYGMTFIKIKKKKDFKSNIKNWKEIFDNRNYYMNYLFKNDNLQNKIINLNIQPDE